MRRIRKIISILMALACVSGLCGCAGGVVDETLPAVTQSSAQDGVVSADIPAPSLPPAQSGASSSVTAQSDSSAITADPPAAQQAQTKDEGMPAVIIQIGNKIFKATLYDNATSKAFAEKLPLTLDMNDLNKNEKYYYFSDYLPTFSQKVGSVKTGDLMLYGSDCLVLFYESFSTSYSYTGLGYIEDTTGLTEALGSGSVQVAFSVEG